MLREPTRVERFKAFMGTAFSRGSTDHLPPMKLDSMSMFITETQADNLRHEVVAEIVDEESELWNDPEQGLVKLEAPEEGKMVRVRVTGQAVIYIGAKGRVNLLDPRP